jgi:mRNA interferase MazF
VKRGEIWWVDAGEPRGSAPACRRPGVIISGDKYNDSVIDTVLVVFLTSNVRLAAMPGNVVLPARGTGLSRESVANVAQIGTVDRDYVFDRIGRVPASLMARIDEGLRRAMAL